LIPAFPHKKPKLWFTVLIAFIIPGTACRKDKSLTVTLTAQSARDMYVSVEIKPKDGVRRQADLSTQALTYAKDFTVTEGDSIFC
jgi:hypothetical protein